MQKYGGSYPDIQPLLAGDFSEETARSLYGQGEEVAIFVMMQLVSLAKKSVDVNDIHPQVPLGSIVSCLKEPKIKQRKKTWRKAL